MQIAADIRNKVVTLTKLEEKHKQERFEIAVQCVEASSLYLLRMLAHSYYTRLRVYTVRRGRSRGQCTVVSSMESTARSVIVEEEKEMLGLVCRVRDVQREGLEEKRRTARTFGSMVAWLQPCVGGDHQEDTLVSQDGDQEGVALHFTAVAVSELTKLRHLLATHSLVTSARNVALAELQSAVSSYR